MGFGHAHLGRFLGIGGRCARQIPCDVIFPLLQFPWVMLKEEASGAPSDPSPYTWTKQEAGGFPGIPPAPPTTVGQLATDPGVSILQKGVTTPFLSGSSLEHIFPFFKAMVGIQQEPQSPEGVPNLEKRPCQEPMRPLVAYCWLGEEVGAKYFPRRCTGRTGGAQVFFLRRLAFRLRESQC